MPRFDPETDPRRLAFRREVWQPTPAGESEYAIARLQCRAAFARVAAPSATPEPEPGPEPPPRAKPRPGPAPAKLPPRDLRRKIATAYRREDSIATIAGRFGLGRDAVRAALVAEGVAIRPSGYRRRGAGWAAPLRPTSQTEAANAR